MPTLTEPPDLIDELKGLLKDQDSRFIKIETDVRQFVTLWIAMAQTRTDGTGSI